MIKVYLHLRPIDYASNSCYIFCSQRLSSAPVPFTVLSITGNPCNEDYLAVCGLKVQSFYFIFFNN